MTAHTETNTDIVERCWQLMEKHGFDVLIAHLAENVLALTGFWSVTGAAVALLRRNERPKLYVPDFEAEFFDVTQSDDIELYEYDPLLTDIQGNKHFMRCVQEACEKTAKTKVSVGGDLDFDTVSILHIGGEVKIPNRSFWDRLSSSVESVGVVNGTALFRALRRQKSSVQIQHIKAANRIALQALSGIETVLEQNSSEIELSSEIETRIQRLAIGEAGKRRARAFVYCMSGENASKAGRPYNISTNKLIREGDCVLLELAVCVEGYWCDLTRTFLVGSVDSRVQNTYRVVEEAVCRSVEACVRNQPSSGIINAAAEVIEGEGLGCYFNGYLGHGVGFAYHEDPVIRVGCESVLENNMILAIEPGIYVPGQYGIRIEHNVLITEDGPEILSV